MNVLQPHLHVILKAQRDVLISTEKASDDPNEAPEAVYSIGTKSGRGVVRKFHDFDCLMLWVKEREGLPAKIEFHKEDEIFVPDDNPDEKEIARRLTEEEKAAAKAEKEREAAEAKEEE